MSDLDKAAFISWPLLVINPMGYNLILIKQEYFSCFENSLTGYTLFLRDIFTNSFLKTYANNDCEIFIGKESRQHGKD